MKDDTIQTDKLRQFTMIQLCFEIILMQHQLCTADFQLEHKEIEEITAIMTQLLQFRGFVMWIFLDLE